MKRRALLFALLLLAVSLAGCMGHHASRLGGRGGGGGASCSDGYRMLDIAQASWHEPGLYAALVEADVGEEKLHVGGMRGALAFPSESLAQRWGQTDFVSLSWRPDDGRAWVRLWLARPGEIELEAPVYAPEDVNASLARVLGTIGLAEHPEREAWARMMWATRGQGAYLFASVVAQPDLSELARSVDQQPWRVVPDAGVGVAVLERDEWSMRLQIPHRTLEGANLTLSVDAADQVWAKSLLKPDEVPQHGGVTPGAWPSLQERVNATFERLGLPAATFANARGGTTIDCRPHG